jgi:8-oxo-dGTP pyrophosphatase MutT (NUDIX family)
MSEKVETWKRTSSREIADCRVFKVRVDYCERESDGKQSTFFVTENSDWANIIALTKAGEVVLIEQFRHGIQEIILEIPGGMIDAGESAETAARRELREETGFTADKFVLLGKSRPNPAISDNWLYHYLALDAEKTHETTFDEHESVVSKIVPLDEIRKLISSEKITHTMVVAAFYYFSLYKFQNG